MVSDVEPVVYAKDVKEDRFKRNAIMGCIVFGILVCALVVVLVLVVFKDDGAIQETGDPRCLLPLEDQSIPIRCFCTNSTRVVWDNSTRGDKTVYDKYRNHDLFARFLQNGEIDVDSCNGFNQALLMISEIPLFKGPRPPPKEAIANYMVASYMYATMGGVRWIQNQEWTGQREICEWFGVSCVFIDVVHGLQLPSNGLQGKLPPLLGLLTSLKALDLSMNVNITGTIPSQIDKMTSLHILNLADLQLTGTIPSHLGSLQYLDLISFGGNQLTGTIPKEIFQLEKMEFLGLAKNQIEGSLPSEVGESAGLTVLDLYSNKLTGTLPSEMQLLTGLEQLDIGSNVFEGTIPDFLGLMPKLDLLNFNGSGLTGGIPETFCLDEGRNRKIIANCAAMPDPPCSCCSDSGNEDDQRVRLFCAENLQLSRQSLIWGIGKATRLMLGQKIAILGNMKVLANNQLLVSCPSPRISVLTAKFPF
jgi:hypothetical protein